MNNLYDNLANDKPSWVNEEEVRKGWLKHLENDLGVIFHAERGKNDASYNQVIIEFKAPDLFKGNTRSVAFKEAIYDRLMKYMRARSRKEGIPEEDYIGIAIDGSHICFAFKKNGKIYPRNLLPFNEASTMLVARACASSIRRAVTAENLVEDFGYSAEIGKSMVGVLLTQLEQKLKERSNNKVKLLFQEWRTLFGQVADLSVLQATQIKRSIPFTPNLPPDDEVAAMLFAVHTYNAFVMKLLAAEIIAQYGLTAYKDFCEHLLSKDDETLLNTLKTEVEQGEFFEEARIKGFVEEAVFSWYVDFDYTDEEREVICAAIRPLLTQLALYRMDDLSAARSHDVLKSFYHSLIPEPLRKALGEFYTPDWLVDVTCDKSDISNWSSIRVLDPTCGSGSFLIEVINRKRKAVEKNNLHPRETISKLLDEVWGFDLNPLAVQASRVNFLIAIADLVAETAIEIELPVLLADAVYSPAHAPSKGVKFVNYSIGSDQTNLNITLPVELAFDRKRLDIAFTLMTEGVFAELPYNLVERQFISRDILTVGEADKWRDALSMTYDQVLNLHKKSWNGIWFRVVRNFFWSAMAGQFDLVIGNPPWVRWSNLPEEYRSRIKPICEKYSIFSETPYHGGNELDISGMITYVVADKWLKPRSSLVFIITQTHFQSASSQGFRNFQINNQYNLIPESVDDLTRLKPFANVANKTAILHLRKVGRNKPPRYPVAYTIWDKVAGSSAAIPEYLTKKKVTKRITKKKWEANPVNGGNSPWAILPTGRFSDMTALQGKSDWIDGRKGVTTDLNGVYMVNIVDENLNTGLVQVETRPEAGKIDIGAKRRFWVEPEMLYPLLKGASDFSACQINISEQLYVFVPNKGIKVADYKTAQNTLEGLIQTKKYFSRYKNQLEKRATYRQRQSGAPYYVVYNSGDYTFAHYKVIWAELSSKFEAAVLGTNNVPLVGNRPYVPDHKIYFVEFKTANPAHFVCGVLNSQIVREYIECHTIQIQVSNIFKHLRIPKFDSSNKKHTKLASLSKTAHSTKDSAKRIKLLAQIDTIAEAIINPKRR